MQPRKRHYLVVEVLDADVLDTDVLDAAIPMRGRLGARKRSKML
jgi:hypothetical protein